MPDTIDWLGEARKIASRVRRANPGVGWDDAIGASHIAVARLLNDFKHTRGKSPLVHVRALGVQRAIDELRTSGLMYRPEQPNRPEQRPTANLDKTNHADPAEALRFLELTSASCLSARERLVLRLRYGESLVFQTIAERTGLAIGTVWSVHRRAIIKLREKFRRGE